MSRTILYLHPTLIQTIEQITRPHTYHHVKLQDLIHVFYT